MSILTEKSKKMLVESMRECLSEVLHESTSLTSKQATEKIKFITESATYEQLLNITLNPHRQEKYQPAYVLEGAVAILHSACMTGRKHIGINAITEGALKLQKKTGAVITESMLDAALTAVNEGAGLKVVGKLLTEVYTGTAAGFANVIDQIKLNPEALKDRGFSGRLLARLTDPSVGLTRTQAVDALRKISTGELNPNSLVGMINLRPQISNIEAEIARITASMGTASPAEKLRLAAEKTNLTNGLNRLKTAFARHSGNVAGGMPSTKNILNSPAAKTPWGKIALGAAAAAGTGALAYQYYKNRKAMNRDIQNGIEQ